MMVSDNTDPCMANAGISLTNGRKWKVDEAVEGAKERLRHKDLVGTAAQERLGLGCVSRQSWAKSNIKERRQLVQAEIRETQEEQREVKAASMKKQGAWFNWERYPTTQAELE